MNFNRKTQTAQPRRSVWSAGTPTTAREARALPKN